MKKKSANKKKEKDVHDIRIILAKSRNKDEQLAMLNRHFNNLRDEDNKKALHSYKNFLEMPEARSLMDYRYISMNNSISDVTSYTGHDQSLEDTISWVTYTLDYYSELINNFVKKRMEFNNFLLSSDFDKAVMTIEKIESETGKSLWSITSYLNVLFFKNDIQSYNNIMKKFMSEPDAISKSYLNYETIRCNKSILPDRYHFYIGKMIEELRLNGDEKAENILLYRHAFDPGVKYNDISFTYRTTYEQRIVDMYCYFMKLLSYLQIHNFNFGSCLINIGKLVQKIDDRDLKIIYARISNDINHTDFLQNEYDSIMNQYISCNYELVATRSFEVLKNHPSFSVLYIPYVKSLIAIKSKVTLPGVIGDMLSVIYNIYEEHEFDKNIEFLSKYNQVLSHNFWATIFTCILSEYDGVEKSNIPLLFNYVDNTSLYRNMMSLREENGHFYSLQKVPEWRNNKHHAEVNYFNRKYEESLGFYKLIDSEGKVQVKPKRIQCRDHLGLINETIAELSKALLSGVNPKSLPLVLVANHLNVHSKYSTDNEDLKNKAIILHFFRLSYSNEYNQTLSNICENYLENLNILNSSEINHRNNIDNYILESVLKLDVLMGMTSIIESDIDRLKCRLNISRYILSNKENYTPLEIENSRNEIKEIFYKTVVEMCSYEVGEGKIYVDKEGLKNKILSDVNRLIAVIAAENDKDIVFDYNEDVNVTYINSKTKLSYYSSEKNYVNLILDLLYFIYTSYTLDKIYGLDQSLNMGIRHGGLVNLLWYPLKNNNLAAVKIKDNKFNPNPTWRNLFGYYNETVLRKVDDALITFNTRVNRIVFEVKNKIHVNMGEFTEQGKWFNYVPGFDEHINLVEGFDTLNSEKIINKVFLSLDEITEDSLKRIRDEFIPDLEGQIMNEIENLESELNSLNFSIVNLKRAVSKSKVEMKEALDILHRWFSWAGESKTNFDITVAIDKAISAVRQFHSWMNIKLVSHITSTTEFQGKFFTDTVMLLTLLFENSVKHSNYKENCTIQIYVTDSNNAINIKVMNGIDAVFSDDKIDIIKNINRDLASNNLDNSTKDSGSGLYKVKKILTHHFKTSSSVNVSHTTQEFIVDIQIDKNHNFMVSL